MPHLPSLYRDALLMLLTDFSKTATIGGFCFSDFQQIRAVSLIPKSENFRMQLSKTI